MEAKEIFEKEQDEFWQNMFLFSFHTLAFSFIIDEVSKSNRGAVKECA